jgi:glycosyltransferase involved in cell wall biosynthesis
LAPDAPPAAHTGLRISLVTETFPPEVNGVAMTWGQLTRQLTAQGHHVQVIRPRQMFESSPLDSDPRELVLVRGFPIPAYSELRMGFIRSAKLASLWRQNPPDVVHVATEGPLGWSAVNTARRLGLPVVSSFHTNFHQYAGHYGVGLFTALVETYLRCIHNRTLATFAPSHAMARYLSQRGMRDVAVLARGVAVDQFSPARRSRELRAQWGAEERTLVVLYVGRLAREKSVDTVIRAFQAIVRVEPASRLVLVGDGPLRASLQKQCPQAIFCGVRKDADLAAHYASGDLFLFPSLTETYGNVVPEALASGLAVLSYDRAAAAQLIAPGENGVLVPPGDELAFIREATDLAQQPDRRENLRRAAPGSIAHLTWSAVAQGYVQALHRIIESRRQAANTPAMGRLTHREA